MLPKYESLLSSLVVHCSNMKVSINACGFLRAYAKAELLLCFLVLHIKLMWKKEKKPNAEYNLVFSN